MRLVRFKAISIMNVTASHSATAPLPTAAGRLAAGSWLAAAVLYLAGEAAAASAFRPSYSYARNYISDLGVPVCGSVFEGRPVCSPLHLVMNVDFVLQGALFVVAATAAARLVATPARHALLACAVLNGIGIALVGLFPETGSGGAHTLGALLAIVFGNATALASAFALRDLGLPRAHRLASLALPILAAVAFSMLLLARARHSAVLVPDGTWERTSVYTITAWELLTGGCLAARLRRRRPPHGR